MGYEFELQDEIFQIHPAHRPDGIDLVIDERRVRADLRPGSEPGRWRIDLDGLEEDVWIASRGDVHFIHLRGRVHRVRAVNALERARRAAEPAGGSEILTAPMPGVVVEILVEKGAEVEAGQLLMTIESMKLQTPILAPEAARVEEVCLSVAASFEQGAALVRLAREEPGEADGASGGESR